jgi:hypothetical protein
MQKLALKQTDPHLRGPATYRINEKKKKKTAMANKRAAEMMITVP